MNFDGFTPHEFTRFGGLVDNDDPTVLPMGVAVVCKNCRFQLTTVATRYGLQTVMQGPNQAAISGLASLIYTPENPGETLFQVPLVFDTDGYLLVDQPSTRTEIEGVFACGDVVDRTYRQAVTAAGSGCEASLDAERWLASHEN